MNITRGGDQPEVRDAELVAVLGTDRRALEVFYRIHVGSVAAFVARRVYDAHAVADIVSNTFLAAINGAGSFDRDRSPDTARFWLLAIARHEVARYHGKAGRQQVLWMREASTRRLSEDETTRIDELIDLQRLAPDVRSALDQLSPRLREALLLVAVDGIPQDEAAAILAISPTALRARLVRARRRLRQHLDGLEALDPLDGRTTDSGRAPTSPPPDPPTRDRSLFPSNLPGGSHGV